jgi:hypothetical protein
MVPRQYYLGTKGKGKKEIIVTSNYTPEECFPDSQNLEPILRRFKVVKFGDPAPAVHPNYTIFAHPQYNP